MAYFEKKHQLEYLRFYMIAHRKFAVEEVLGKVHTLNSVPFSFYRWDEVADILNGFGPKQEADEWKYIWKCICFRVFRQHEQDWAKLTWQDKQIVRLLESELELQMVEDKWYFVRRRNTQVMELTDEERKSIYSIEAESLQSSLPGDSSGTMASLNINDDANSVPQSSAQRKKFILPPHDETDETDQAEGEENGQVEKVNKGRDEENSQGEDGEEIVQQESNEEKEQVEDDEEIGHEECDDDKGRVESSEEIVQEECNEEKGQVEENNEEIGYEDKGQLENNEEIDHEECDEQNGQVENNQVDNGGHEKSRRIRDGPENPVEFRVQANEKKAYKGSGQDQNKRKVREIEPNRSSNSQAIRDHSVKRHKSETTTKLSKIPQDTNVNIQILRDIAETMKTIAVTFPQAANALIAALKRNEIIL